MENGIDDNRTNIRSRLKAMSVMKECYKYKMKMLATERMLNQTNTMYKQMLVKERDLTKRESALKAFLEERNLTKGKKILKLTEMPYSKYI